tara:strand:- start:110 stop:1141 length:1032 start_codon:yes stop_codon:yes gene_type:complete
MVLMIISCPNCSTTYKVDNAILGPQGKSVQCSNCGQQWHQLPVKPAPAKPAYASQSQIQPATMIDPTMLQAQILAQMQAMMSTNQIPQTEQIQSVANPASQPPPNLDPIPKQVPEEEPPSQEELNNMFGKDEPEPPVSLMAEEVVDVDDGYDNLDDIPDPDPIPESLMSKDAYDEDSFNEDEDDEDEDDEDEDEKSSSIGLILGVILLFLIAGIAATGYFLRDMVLETIPETKPLYDMIGLSDPLGVGLDIQDVQSQREQEGDIDILNVTGNIVNISEKLRTVPLIRISLFNEENEEMQFINITPVKAEIPAGEKMNFQGSIIDPAEKAKKMEVTFTEPEIAE